MTSHPHPDAPAPRDAAKDDTTIDQPGQSGLPGGVSLIHSPASFVERLDLVKAFPVEQPLEVELGAGDGSFLVKWAGLNPPRNFLGVERLLGRLRKIDRKGRRAGLTNLRALRIEAGYCVEFLLPPKSVQTLHVYFPDPWPKKKHRRRRLINDRFTELASHALAPGGVVYLRTDNADYFAQMTEVFDANAAFHPVPTPENLCAVVTDFEREFNAQGIPTLRAAYQFG
jgi:tRNA (guanine-N7-)-methyltransferase